MSFILQADNRVLTANAKYSYLSTNYASGVSALVVVNSTGFDSQYVLLGNFGSETTEIVKVSSTTAATHTLNLAAETKFAHPESTKVTIIPFDQVHFYHTTTTTYGTATPVAAAIDIQANRWYSQLEDTTYTTGYGWFTFENSTDVTASDNSNAIPYAGAEPDSLQILIDDVYSLLNNKERTLVSTDNVITWANEAYSIAVNELNLVNKEFYCSPETDLTITGGVQEVALADDFSDLVYVRGSEDGDLPMSSILIRDIPYYLTGSQLETKYYIRGSYIGFVPIPLDDDTFKYRYRTKASRVASYSDILTLPDNGYYAIKDYVIFRAQQKSSNPSFTISYKTFGDWIARQKNTSIERDDSPSCFGISPEALA